MHVYLVTNTVNGKVYVGKTEKAIEKRWEGHCNSARKGGRAYFYCAIRKYGPAAFRITEIGTASTREELNFLEKSFIQKYRSNDARFGYNQTAGSDGGALLGEARDRYLVAIRASNCGNKFFGGRKHTKASRIKIKAARKKQVISHSEETRKKMAAAQMRHLTPQRTRRKIAQSLTGLHPSEETRVKMTASQRARQARCRTTVSPETRAKIATALRGRSASEETRQKMSESQYRWQETLRVAHALLIAS